MPLHCKNHFFFSREKANLDQLFEANDWLTLLKRVIGLDGNKINFTKKTSIVAVEAEKFLCNLVFNNKKAVRECSENDILYNINDRIKFYRYVLILYISEG